MASQGNMILFTYILGFIILLGYSGDYYTHYGFKSEVGTQANITLQNFFDKTSSIQNATHVGVNIPFVGTFQFPNPFTIFLDVFDILISLVFAPQALINAFDIPGILKYGLIGFLTILEIYLAVTWFKGQGN